ncbi:hypothetical protein C8K30_104319 [Promicromonospora sp. AC04]|uniref:restriction system modified-DNA reader domain-containing protein n=1 Tax=Promicromonospora sp. AC04 TaxID=2135723 RepID=UPI000D415C4B|nr:hypothetical protein [Promicromonospora sp. AC04]PUB27867.1 hypothetical protein C8K30_104319 [Promicromonospora sp. AC04]
MPLFEVDTQRPLLVTSANGADGAEPGLKTTANQVVDSHIDGLLGEEVFPIAQGSGPDEPHLLALDASGSPVVVELVADLDRENLAKALDHAGAAGRLTRSDLAARYSGGASSFQHDVAAFYDSVPITRTQAGKNSGNGARLIIICQNAPDEILNAVDFLRQPTMPVEVLKMGVVNSNDGRKFLDVSPLVVHLPPGLPAPKSAPIGGAITSSLEGSVSSSMDTGVTGGVAGGSAAPKDAFEEGVKVGYALTGKMPVVAQAPQARSGRSAAQQSPSADNPSSGPTNAATGLRSSLRGGAQRGAPERAGTRAARRAQAAAATSDAAPAPSGPAAPSDESAPSAPVSRVRPGADSRPTPSTPPRLAASRSSLGDAGAPARVETPAEPTPSVRRRSRTDRFTASAQPDEPAAASAYPASDPTPSAQQGYSPAPVPQPPAEQNLWQPAAYEEAPAYAGAPANEPIDFDVTMPRYEREPAYNSAESSFAPAPAPAPAAPGYGYTPEAPPGYGDQDGYGYGEQPGYEPPYADNAAPVVTEQSPWESGGYMAGPDDGYAQTAFAADPYPSSAPEAPARPVPPGESIRASTPMLFEEEDDPDLEALARSLGTPTRIVWSRPRRNQHFEATLLPDGSIELANGARYRHPDSAATAASGSYTADGWSVWRIGDTGPTLVEEFSRRFA